MTAIRLRVPLLALAAACLLAGRGAAQPALRDSVTQPIAGYAGGQRVFGDSTAAPEAQAALRAQVRVATRTSPDSLTVGDHVTLEVFVDTPPGCEVRFPDRMEPGGPVDFVDLEVVPPKGGRGAQGRSDGRTTWVGRYELSVFQVGHVVLPPWSVEVRRDGQSVVASSDSIRMFVQSVLTDSLRQAGFGDLESQVKLSSFPWLYVGIGAAALAIVLLVVWLVLRRRRRRAVVVPIERVRPAHQVALEALRKLEAQHLPIDGKFVEYYVRLSEILRRYLEDGFGVAALEETTEEILFDLDRHGFDRVTVKQVDALCNESDLVKFAKHEPTIDGCQESMEHVRDFVTSTAARSAASQAPVTLSTGTIGPPPVRASIAGAASAAVSTPVVPRIELRRDPGSGSDGGSGGEQA